VVDDRTAEPAIHRANSAAFLPLAFLKFGLSLIFVRQAGLLLGNLFRRLLVSQRFRG
jgi:hypothetical protein